MAKFEYTVFIVAESDSEEDGRRMLDGALGNLVGGDIQAFEIEEAAEV